MQKNNDSAREKTFIRKTVSLALCVTLLLPLLSACSFSFSPEKDLSDAPDVPAATEAPAPEPTPEPSGDAFDLVIPAVYAQDEMLAEYLDLAQQAGIQTSDNPDGSRVYSMTADQQTQLLTAYKEKFDSAVKECIASNYYPEIKDIQVSGDYKELKLFITMDGYENGGLFTFAVYVLGMAAPLYQECQGNAGTTTTVMLINEATGDVLETQTAPDSLGEALQNIGGDPGDIGVTNGFGNESEVGEQSGDTGLTLEAIKQIALDSGYEVENSMGYSTSKDPPIPEPIHGFNIKHGGLKYGIQILEFSTAGDARTYVDYVQSMSNRTHDCLKGRFVMEYTVWNGDNFSDDNENQMSALLFGAAQ